MTYAAFVSTYRLDFFNTSHPFALQQYGYILIPSKNIPYTRIYRVSQEERTKLREGVPYVKLYRYNPKHLCPKLNGY